MQTPSAQRGFTLIELMVIIIIIGILAAIVVPSYQRYARNARLQNAQADLMQVQNMMEKFYAQNASFHPNNAYPTAILNNFNNEYFNFGFYAEDEAAGAGNDDPDGLTCDPSTARSEQYCLYAVPNANNAGETRFLFVDGTGIMQVCERGGATIADGQLTGDKLSASCTSN